jgi:hypothetical protein
MGRERIFTYMMPFYSQSCAELIVEQAADLGLGRCIQSLCLQLSSTFLRKFKVASVGIVDGIPSNANSNFVTGRACKIWNFHNT